MKRKISASLIMIEVSMLLLTLIIFIIAHKETLKFVTDKAFKENSITYEKLSGNLLTNLNIKNLKFENKKLADEFNIDWKLLPLLKGNIVFRNISLHNINIDTVMLLSKQLSDKNASKEESELFIPIITIDNFFLTLPSCNYENVNLEKISLIAEDIKFENRNIMVDSLASNIKSIKYDTFFFQDIKLNANNIKSDLANIDVKNIKLKTFSNVSNMKINGKIIQNKFIADSKLKLSPKYFSKYSQDINISSLNPILLSTTIDQKGVTGNVKLKSSNIFQGKLQKYQVSINSLNTDFTYNFNDSKLLANSNAILSSLYAKNIEVKNRFTLDKNIQYNGKVLLNNFANIPQEFIDVLKNLSLTYHGDIESINIDAVSEKLKANFSTKGFKKGELKLETKQILAREFIQELPKSLKEAKGKISAQTTVDFQNIQNTKGKFSFISNIIDLKGNFYSDKTVQTEADMMLSKNSLLAGFDKNIKLSQLFPSKLHLNITDEILKFTWKNNLLSTLLNYDLKEDDISAKFNFEHHQINLDGKLNEKMNLQSDIVSLRELQNSFEKIYNFKKVPIDGELSIKSSINKLEKLDTKIDSLWFLYEYAPNRFAFAEKIKMQLEADKDSVTINSYYFDVLGKKFFADKPSKATFDTEHIKVENFWINDNALIKGQYNLEKQSGQFQTTAKNFHYKGVEGDISFNADLQTTLSKEKIETEGDIEINQAAITYEAKKSHYIQDKDIIIIQEEREKKEHDNLALNINVITKKPIKYKIPNINADLETDIKIWKEKEKEVEILGIVKLLKGVYKQSKKEFYLEPGEVLFGGSPFNPYLNIKTRYKSEPYQITIDILGTLESPVINFSSDPYLSQSDILSIILFNTTTSDLFKGKEQSASNQVISMFGNTFAREIVENFGIKLDRLVLLTSESGKLGIEIGKKISDKITLIYINDEVSSIKLKYEHSPKFETDLSIKPNSSSIDFFYKKEY